MSKPDVSIVIVSFNVYRLLDQCLASLFATRDDLQTEVIVIDNASEDNTVSLVRAKHPRVRLIVNDTNLGFAKATNQGLQVAKGKHIFLLNPDTVVLPGTMAGLARFLDETRDAGAVGPRLLNPDGSLQPSCRSFPNLLNMAIFSFASYDWLPRQSNPMRHLLEGWDHSRLMAVDYVIGAALMIKRTVLEHVGLLDESFFLYGEEKDWCYRLRQAGYQTYYLPNAQVIHFGGQSSRQVTRFAVRHLYASHERFLRMHYGFAYAQILIGILRMGLAHRAVKFGALGLFQRRKRAGLWQKAAVYASVLKS